MDSPAEFERVLRLGLGRAILFLRQHDARPYRDIILDACTHWTGYDQQVEGSRTTYLRDVLDATDHERAFVPRILAALRNVSERRDANQLAFLALSLAQDGYEAARTALYEMFDRDNTEEPFLGYDAIIKLDGLDGLLHVAERVGAALLDGDDVRGRNDWVFATAISEAEEQCGKEAVRQALERAAQESPRVRAYVQAAEALETEYKAGGRRPLPLDGATYERVRQVIVESGSSRVGVLGLRRWGEHASAKELARAAADLGAEEDDHRLISYLRIFQWRAFPGDPDRLLALMDRPNDQVVRDAAQALSRVSDPRVRTRGLEILAAPDRHGSRKSAAVDLLVSSYQPGDEAVLVDLISTPRDEDELHWIGMGARDVVKANPAADAAPVLLALYEYGPCSFCRDQAVSMLRKRGQLPNWMLEECRYDAGEYLREAAEAWARGVEPADA